MSTRPDLPPAYTVADLMVLTGFGRDKVKAMMREGKLPGLVHGQSYSCPRVLWDSWCEHQSQPRPETPAKPRRMVHHRPVREEEGV